MFLEKNGCLYYEFDHETLKIEPWGENAVRIRATKNKEFTNENWALEEVPQNTEDSVEIKIVLDTGAAGVEYANMYSGKNTSYGSLKNGKITAVVNADGVLSFYNQKKELLLMENWKRLKDIQSTPLNVYGREYRGLSGDSYKTTIRFVSNDREKLFGMGQYQQKYFNLKGCMLELAQRNSQVTIPFYVSSIGYGFLWNNPAVGQVAFGVNGTEWVAESTKEMDYLVIAGDQPSEIEETYMQLVGKPPMMPEYGMGFWQCKLRYQTQEELIKVARRYSEEGIHLDVIIADFFHWTQQGEYKFDETYWPDVAGMCDELEEMGTKLMVSVWPTVDYRSENFREMLEKGYLVRTEQGVRITMTCFGQEVFYDATNPDARTYVWDKIKENYWDKGARLYWLDVAEPEYTAYDFQNYRYHLGSVLEVGNIYPKLYLKGFHDGMAEEGDKNPLCLIRSAWAGSAKYGGLVWSGDIVSTFECFNRQLRAGLSMAMAGIPWWTTDIGGFHGGTPDDPAFRELIVRWMQYSCFCPVFRMHGNREPQSGFEGDMVSGSGLFGTGGNNEIWSFGDKVFEIFKKYIAIREKLRPYIREHMKLAHEIGRPMMRPLFYDYPYDKSAWEIDDTYLFGSDLLVAPILEEGAITREIYLPEGTEWIDFYDGSSYVGGTKIFVDAPIDKIPVFIRKESYLNEIQK